MAALSTREIAHDAIRTRLAHVTLQEVMRHGFDGVTLHELASAAGVSRSTYLRYLGSKENAVLVGLSAIGEDLAERLGARPAAEDDWQALRRAMDLITETQNQDDTAALNLTKLLKSDASLGGAQWQHRRSWRDALTSVLLGRAPGRSHLATAALAAAALGCLDAATDAWTDSDGALDFDAALDEAFASLEPS
ncbi:TetR/AcrR family transcriptional regulator [Actinomadura sp. CNU-125]|uniref:TetR/AcrR family transcriptional regulator n=1 Tax=Actinomadura sp. CNU-125 TaxID=1904961 RepID=UPI0021CCC7AF|nr:TetR/AcrR family transcriptional regulator [Actinomadura sp. CNU-125]